MFGLSTAPGALDSFFDRWAARVDGLASPAMTYLYLYSQMIVYSMLVTFVTHLFLRGYWIALLGLESVWSDGWNWDRLTIGPFTREHLQRRVTSLSAAINRADDRASVIFAAGTLLVVISLHSLVVASARWWLACWSTPRRQPGARALRRDCPCSYRWWCFPARQEEIGRRFDPHSRAGGVQAGVGAGIGSVAAALDGAAAVTFSVAHRRTENYRSRWARGQRARHVLVLGMAFRAGRCGWEGCVFRRATGGGVDRAAPLSRQRRRARRAAARPSTAT